LPVSAHDDARDPSGDGAKNDPIDDIHLFLHEQLVLYGNFIILRLNVGESHSFR
jgi:hypothetical protein